MNALPPYPATQETGIPWLGRVPAHWEALPNRALFREISEKNHPDEPMLSVTIKNGVIKQKELLEDSSKKDGSRSDKSGYKLVRPGDFAYNKMRAWQGAIGASKLQGIISPAYIVQRLRSSDIPQYFHYLFRTPMFAKEAERWSYGITSDMWSLRSEHFKLIYSPRPPKDEQDAIARYLDWADSRIRRLIRARQQQIKLLEEYKQAIIQQTVTGQIDVSTGKPYPAYKDSGVAWLGQVPEHWEVVKLGHGALTIQTGPFGSQVHNHDYISNGIPLINPSHMKEGMIVADPNVTLKEEKALELSRHLLQKGDIVVARRGELGRCALVTENEAGWLCGTGSLKLQLKTELFIPNYILLILSSQGMRDFLKILSIGSTMDNLNAGLVARLHMPKPPITEQQEIINFINKQISQVEQAVAQINNQLKSLQEYSTRLIADVVTGKVDVRQAAEKLPALEEELEEAWQEDEIEDEEDFEEDDDAQQDE